MGEALNIQSGGAPNPNNQASAIRFYTPERRGQFTGNVNNSGTLAAENGPAVVVEENITLRGNINNSGLLESANPDNGIGVLFEDGSRFTGTLFNSGTINGGRDGVNFGNGGTARGVLVNEEGGIITSASRAVNIGGNRNTIRNEGLITTSADPRNGTIYADQSANNFRIINESAGVIDVGKGLNGDAISLQLGANVRGKILADRDGLRIGLTFNGDINNFGDITGGDDDIDLREVANVDDVTVTGDLNNRGTILGGDDGIVIANPATLDGSINNRGNILAERDNGIDVQGGLTGAINRCH